MKVQYILPLLVLTSCNLIDNQPKCSDENVKKLALEILKEKLKPNIIDNYMKEHINYDDLSEYAWDNSIPYDKVEAEAKNKLKDEAEIEAVKILNDIKLENILTSKIDNEIKKCDCEANIKSQYLNEIEAHYSAQLNDEEKLNVELLYKVKNN